MPRRINGVLLAYLFIGLLVVFWLGSRWQDWLSHRELDYRPAISSLIITLFNGPAALKSD